MLPEETQNRFSYLGSLIILESLRESLKDLSACIIETASARKLDIL
jgi:hypothetical protein